MEIEVRLFATLREGRLARQTVSVTPGARLADLLAQLLLPADVIAIRLVNGREAQLDHPLHPADVVSLFPAVGGG
jgi:sulfur-carrier protein